MACIVEGRFHAIAEGYSFSVSDRREEREAGFSVDCGIKRGLGVWAFSALLFVPFAFMLCIFLLYFGRIQQYDFGNFGSSSGTIYPAAESLFDQLRQ
jgi:hypothetical protein